jgi:cytoskeletal protein CcmA (bactofilin family)
MNSRRYWLIFIVIIFALIILGIIARQWVTAQEVSFGEGIKLNSDYRLDGTYEGDLAVFAGDITLAQESQVTGDASLIGGTISVNGSVDGDLTAVGDHVTLAPSSHVSGDLSLTAQEITLGGQVDGDASVSGERVTILPGARIAGDITPCAETVNDQRVDAAALQSCNVSQWFAPFQALIALRSRASTLDLMHWSASGSALLTLAFTALVLTGISTLAVTLFPRQISRIEEAIRTKPRGLGGAGFAVFALCFGVSAALVLALALLPPVGLLLLPVYLLVGLALLALVAAGLITLSLVIGDWLVRRLARAAAPPLVTVVVGSLALSALLTLVALLPFGYVIGLATVLALSSVGVGAALFTRLGTRPLRRSYFVQG